MKVLGMGMPELLIILAVVLLIFGPKHLPKLGSALGSTVKNLRAGLGSSDSEEETEEEIYESEEDSSSQAKAKAIEDVPVKKAAPSKKVKAKAATSE
jgi:sec-independent protein translocase protein TatA